MSSRKKKWNVIEIYHGGGKEKNISGTYQPASTTIPIYLSFFGDFLRMISKKMWYESCGLHTIPTFLWWHS